VTAALRLRHGGVVALLAVGLLTMHGLASASSRVGHDGHVAATEAVAAEHGVHASLDQTMGGGGHDLLHDVGHACLWLLAGSALLFSARRLGSVAIRRGASTSDPRALAWAGRSPLHRPPDSMATVVLRC
jgi:hypothetical protein